MVDVHKWYYKKRTTSLPSALAPLDVEMLNLWRDFRKVVEFIDDNEGWLLPLMDIIEQNKNKQ